MEKLPDARQINPITADEMARSQRDQFRLLIHLAHHIRQANAAQLADVHEPHLDSFFRQRHPGINVGGKIVEVDQDVVVLSQRQSVCDRTQSQRGRAEQSNFLRLRVEQAGGELAGLQNSARGPGRFLIIERDCLRK